MNYEQFHKVIGESTGNESNVCQIYAIRDEKTVFDDCWRGFRTDDAVNVNSVTKGVMALLAGIALDQGRIKSVDQKVLDKYTSEPWTKVCTSGDWTLAVLDFLGGRKGITGEFKYATLGIQILAGIIENATRERCIDFANRYLFLPLGIPKHVIHGGSSKEDQFDFFMNKKPRKNEWYSDPKGVVTAGWGLCMSARDLAKLGAMVAEGGMYGGKRILSEGYLKEMTAPHLKLGERFGNMNYGYLWYKPYDDREVYAAIGDSGNIIYVDTEKHISVGMTGTFKPRIFDRVEFIEKKLLPMTPLA